MEAAAYAAKAITQELALIISYYRGRAAKACRKGAMAAVAVDRATMQKYIGGDADVVIACENGPQSLTISGAEHAISRVVGCISKDYPDVRCRRLQVDVAYHSRRPPPEKYSFTRALAEYTMQTICETLEICSRA